MPDGRRTAPEEAPTRTPEGAPEEARPVAQDEAQPTAPGELQAPLTAAEATPAVELPAQVATATMTQWQLSWRRFKRHKLALVSAVILGVIALLTIFVNVITPFGYSELDLEAIRQGPNLHHWFGTDVLGRDEFTRVMYGGRISLLVAVSVAISSTIIGTAIGAVSGYYGGWLDNLLMRITDLFLSVPLLVILIIAATALGGVVPTPWDIVLTLAIFFWMPLARIVRGLFLSFKEKEFVEAARAMGASNKRIIFYHVVPNAMGPIIVTATLAVAAAILNESVLSFLGFGIQPPKPSWGNLLADSRNLITAAPWLLWFPGLMILITVLCVNFLGDGLRDALDPHQQLKGAV
jgi:peptide/nickel transport system permease protein